MKHNLSATALPAQAEVAAELEAYLTKMARSVTPSEAYRALADKFGLSREERTRLMRNGNRVHWENIVQWARKELNDVGKLDRSQPRGKWAIKQLV